MLPPLRERGGDVVVLAHALLRRYATGAAKGTYKFIIMARDNASPGVSNNGAGTTYDTFTTLSYTLT